MILNRLQKNYKKLKPWAERNSIEAYRLYDRDIPEFPFIVDLYKDYILIHDKSITSIDAEKNHQELLLQAIKQLFPESISKIVFKKRERQEGLKQYEKLATSNQKMIIQEGKAKFWINLYDYLDTGLFLDHRPLRYEFTKLKKPVQFLNLFCYTGSVSVAAALGGATTKSVDMSRTYLDWAQENFQLNNIDPDRHQFIHENALEFLQNQPAQPQFDIIFLDPPTFSNSKRMGDFFEVEKDQEFLVHNSMKLLNPQGKLYFSNNKRKFKLSEKLKSEYRIKDISAQTIPMDFHDQKIHQCYEITNL